ncbi:glycosyltransferase family 4 protein [Arhodomonas sp. AD133]|uniref:glycosyltransferase family 4 protein n=1 Tax=Arhodomonas sp. AD133 TaxID=3415009 RepID=UPI003EBB1742
MESLVATVTALVVSLLTLGLMVRLAPTLGMLDYPNSRKVHTQPIPRVGGWGIVCGAVVAILLWVPINALTLAFVWGSLILLIGGAADDRWDLRATTKLAVQFAASLPVVWFAGLAVQSIPLFGEHTIAYPVAIAITGVGLVAGINATNTSDGLDGLAGGESLLSLAGVSYLAYATGNTNLLFIAAAAAGGLLGFLRYNTHPATIFMGDAGSQFLGFAVAVLGLALVRPEAGSLSPWTMLLVMGLPLFDLAVAAVRRLMRGVSCFRPDRNHIHHRLLDLGFSHNQAVVIIYVAQTSFVFFAIVTMTSTDWKILLVYVLHIAVLYGFLILAEGSQRENHRAIARLTMRSQHGKDVSPILVWAPRILLETVIPLVLVICASLASDIPDDFSILGGALLVAMAIHFLTPDAKNISMARIPIFIAAAAIVYLYTENRPFLSATSHLTEAVAFSGIIAATASAIRFSPKRRQREFYSTGIDSLVALLVFLTFSAFHNISGFANIFFVIYLPIILYGCEIILVERRERKDWLPFATFIATIIFTLRALV